MARQFLGEFEQLVLLAVLRLRNEAHGMKMRAEIQERTNRVCSLGAIYTTLERLEAKGLVSSWIGEPTPARGGRAKKFFKIGSCGPASTAGISSSHRQYGQGTGAQHWKCSMSTKVRFQISNFDRGRDISCLMPPAQTRTGAHWRIRFLSRMRWRNVQLHRTLAHPWDTRADPNCMTWFSRKVRQGWTAARGRRRP